MAESIIASRPAESDAGARITYARHPSFRDLSGQQFARWTVIGQAISPELDHRKTWWACRCQCGEQRIVRSYALTGGTSQSCGCLRDETIKEHAAARKAAKTPIATKRDLSGKRFGRWLVVDQAPSTKMPSGRTRNLWNCVCRCGYQARIEASSLVSGRSQSCGCLKSDILRKIVKPRKARMAYGQFRDGDLTGEQFGRWTVLAAAPDHITKSGEKRPMWSCACSCGTTKDVVESNLLRGQSRSCGCLRREILPEARRLARLRRQVESVSNKVSASNKTASTVLPAPAR